MKKLTKKDLLPKAKELHAQGHKKLHATHDGQFFTDSELAASHAKTIDSEVHKFSSEDLTNVSEEAPETVPTPAPASEPKSEPAPSPKPAPAPKKVIQPKKK